MKKIILFAGMIILSVSCTQDITDLNQNSVGATTAPEGSLFANAQKNLVDYMSSTNVNTNDFRLFVQQWTETTYLDESRYDILQRNVPDNTWRTLYRDVLRDLKEASNITSQTTAVTATESATQANKMAIIEVLNVYTYTVLVDIFGNVPYTQALQPESNPSPQYDDAKAIYTDLFARLNAAIAMMDDSAGSFGTSDLIFGGDVSSWVIFANSLKLRMAIEVADEPSMQTLSQTSAEEAVASGVFTSSDNNASLTYLGIQPNTNPLYEDLVTSGRYDFIAAEPFVNYMNSTNDPRRPLYYIPIDGVFVGGPYAQGADDFASYSSAGDPLAGPTTRLLDPTIPGILMDYTEVEFLLAEAVERGYAVGSDAATHYNNAVTSSILYWGGSQADADAFLAQPDIAYATAAGDWRQKIGNQAWVGYFNRGFEAWTTWRRLDFPQLAAPANAVSAAEGEIPKRFTYPVLEQTLNNANYLSASSAIGGDRLKTHIFWDKF